MKKIILSALVVAAMASCSKNEVMLDGTQREIGFDKAQFGNSVVSRASGDLGTTISLGVFAYQTTGTPASLYINDVLSYQTNAWKLGATYYWPATDPELKFYAYGPAGTGKGIDNATCAVNGTPTFDYTVTGTAPSQTDVIVDLAGQTKSSGAVTFNLSHVLTQLQFKAQLSASPNSTLAVKINSIKVNAPASAKFAINATTASWTGHTGTNTTYTALGTETAVTAANGSSVAIGTAQNMIPESTKAQIEVMATAYSKVTNALVGSKTITISCDGTTAPFVAKWVAGTQVTYTITLDPDAIAAGSGTAITFGQPTVNSWTSGSGNIEL